MGLADLFKGTSAGQRHKKQAGVKRPRQEPQNGTHHPAADSAELAGLAGSQSIWKTKLTRTARRKHHKALRQARYQQQQQQEPAAQQDSRGKQREQPRGGGDSSDDDGEDLGAGGLPGLLGLPGAGSANGHLNGGELQSAKRGGRGAGAYGALLGALQGSSAAFAELYQQRRREEAGLSDEESSDEEEEEEEEGGGGREEEEEEGGGKGGEGSGGDEESTREGGAAEEGSGGSAAANGSDIIGRLLQNGGGSDSEQGGSGLEGEEEEEGGYVVVDGEQQQTQQGSNEDEEEEDDGFVLVAGGTDEAAAGELLAAGLEGGGRQRGQQAERDGAAARAGPAPEDHFVDQFDRVLTDTEVAVLSAREGAGPPRYEDRAPSAPWLAKWSGTAVEAAPGTRLPQQAPAELASYGVKERLQTRWREEACGGPLAVAAPSQQQQQHPRAADGGAAAGAGAERDAGSGAAAGGGDFASPQQQALFALLNSYVDLLFPCRPYPTDAAAPDPALDAVLLHVLNHCAKAADRVRKNNERLKAQAKGGGGGGGAEGGREEPPRDQGFVRPKVLLLLPYRNSAYRAVLRLLRLAVKETRKDTIQNKERFLEEFGPGDEELSERERRAIGRKPADFRALFDGNMDDHFRMGIKLTRGAVRLYTDFFQSDIIVASPLALATKLGEGPGEDGKHPQDFLSSIEVVVVERADVMLMQNWNHVATVFEALNKLPHQQHGVDIMRVREWALSGWARLYRQTILLTSFASPEMNALLGRRCANHAGAVRLRAAYHGLLGQVLPQVRQVFERLPAAAGLAAEADARFEHFRKTAWPRMKEAGRGGGQLIYVPSYFDFVRVRNFLRAEAASFLVLSEYTDKADAARARSYFFDGRKQVLLFTERAQFYNRNRIRGIKDVLFYQLPEHAQFYPEILNLLEEGGEAAEHATVSVLFGRADALRLERVVGSARSAKMLKGSTNAFLFC